MKPSIVKRKCSLVLLLIILSCNLVYPNPYKYSGGIKTDVSGQTVTICAGEYLTALTIFLKSYTYTFQWQGYMIKYGWYDISKATSSTYIPLPSTLNNKYRCIFSINGKSDTTGVVTVSARYPEITSLTVPSETCTNAVQVSCVATGYPLSIDFESKSTNAGSTWAVLPGDGTSKTQTFDISDLNGKYIRVKAYNTCGEVYTETTSPASITLLNTESVALSDATKNLCMNEVGQITATPQNINTGWTYSYSWYVSADSGGTWNQITSTSEGLYADWTTGTLSITPSETYNPDNYLYKCYVGGKCWSGFSAACQVSVKKPPVISGFSVVSDTVCKGTYFSVTVSATGSDLQYSWEMSGIQVTGTTNTLSYQMPNTGSTYLLAGVTVSNTYCAANVSGNVPAWTYPDPSLLVSERKADCSGTDKILTANITGGRAPFSYSWGDGQTTQEITISSSGTYTVTITDACGTSAYRSYSSTTAPAFSAAFASTNATCNGLDNASITVTCGGGTAPYTLTWDDTAGVSHSSTFSTVTPQVLSDLVPGTYSLDVTDNCSSTFSENITLTEPDTLLATITKFENVACAGKGTGTATVTVTGGTSPYSYFWDDGQRTAKAIGLMAGKYTVQCQDKNQCLTSKSITIAEPEHLQASASCQDASCFGRNDGSVTIAITGGTAPYTYEWSNGLTSSFSDELPAGSYTITVADACSEDVVITNHIYQPDQLSVLLTSTDISCFGFNDGAVTATVSGGVDPYTYLWSNDSTGSYLNNLQAGSDSLVVTDACLDSVTSVAVIEEPQLLDVSITVEDPSCNTKGDGSAIAEVTGGTSPYTYTWNNGQTTSSISSLFGGNYTLNVFDNNGCLASEMVTLTQPAILAAYATAIDADCHGAATGSISTTVTNGLAPYHFLWSDSSEAGNLLDLVAGTYHVTISDECYDEVALQVNIGEPDSLSITLDKTDVECADERNGSATIAATGGTGAYTFAWSNSATSNKLTSLAAGTYTVTVSDGCQSKTDSVVLANPEQVFVVATYSDALCAASADGWTRLAASGGTSPYHYSWSFGSSANSVGSLFPGIYSYSVHDAKGCATTGVVQIGKPQALQLSLTAGQTLCGTSDANIIPTISGGTLPYTYAWSNLATTQDIDGLAAGVYSLTVTDANGCSISDSATVKVSVQSVPLCLVTVDSTSSFNRVVWERPYSSADPTIAFYKVYAWYGEYTVLDTVLSTEYSQYNDRIARPRQMSYQYALSTVDKCGNESELSPFHSTMLAWSSPSTEPNTTNIQWESYIDQSGDFVPDYYHIYKGTSSASMILFDSVPGTSSAYIDYQNDGALYYRVGFTKPQACVVTGLKSDSGPYSQSLSNIAESELYTSCEELDFDHVTLHPNPTRGYTEVSGAPGKQLSVTVADMLGRVVATREGRGTVSIDCSPLVSGLYTVKILSGEEPTTRLLLVE